MTDLTVDLCITSILKRGKRGGAIVGGLTSVDERYVAIFDYHVLSNSSLIEKGQQWEISGSVETKVLQRNGCQIKQQQIKVRRAKLLEPTGKNIIEWISRSRDCPGIGKVKATKLWRTFGTELIELIERRDIAALSTIITEYAADLLCHAFDKVKIARSLLWLDQIGIPHHIGQKVVAYYKDKLRTAMEANPYALLSFEARWDVVDQFALRRLGIAEDDPRRLEAAVEEVLYRGFSFGHTCRPEADVKRGVRALIGTKDDLAITTPNRRWHYENGMYQTMGSYVIECYIADRLKAMVAGEQVLGQQALFAPAHIDGEAIAKALAAFETAHGFELTSQQSEAVMTSTSSYVSLILGGAGCGKTTVLKALYTALEAVQPAMAIHQVALAGRAAKRMTEATGRPASTIASFLANVDPRELQPGSVVVVDEMSMVDAFLMYRFLRRLPQAVRLVLVGDPAQLPPIGPGLVLHALAGHPEIPQTTLTTTKRQSSASGIPKAAEAIRRHQVPVYASYKGLGSGVSFVSCKEHELDQTVLRIYAELGGSGDDYSVQILSPTKSGAGGTRNLNVTLHNHFHTQAQAQPVYYYDTYGKYGTVQAATAERVLLRVGDLVLFMVNDYELELRNGSLGRVIEAKSEVEVSEVDADCCVVEWDDGRQLALKTKQIYALTHSYALTIHKSQGSQFNRVIVPIRRNRLLDQSLIYTAVTRGVEQVVLVGDEKAALNAILAPPSVRKRHLGLPIMLAANKSGPVLSGRVVFALEPSEEVQRYIQ